MSGYLHLRQLVATDDVVVPVYRNELAQLLEEFDQLRAAAPKAKQKKAKFGPHDENLPDWLPIAAWEAFLDMRKQIKKPATEYARKLLLKKLGAFYAADMDPAAILNQSIMNDWQDLYEPKGAERAQVRPVRPAQLTVQEQNARNTADAKRLLGFQALDEEGQVF